MRFRSICPYLFAVLAALVCFPLPRPLHAEERLLAFVGSASQPPTEEAIKLFTARTGIAVDATYGGSGFVLSQMALARQGDIYFPGSSDYMEMAKREGYVLPGTETRLVYLVPAINVPKGNPKGIRTLADLARPGLKVAIANPDGVCVGAYAVELVESALPSSLKTRFRRNLVNFTASCAATATVIALGQVDAVIGWRVFQYWDPERIETVPLSAGEIRRIGYLPMAVSRFSNNPDLARRFIEFMTTDEVKRIFARYHYFMTPEEAFAWIGEPKPVGGEYRVPSDWLTRGE